MGGGRGLQLLHLQAGSLGLVHLLIQLGVPVGVFRRLLFDIVVVSVDNLVRPKAHFLEGLCLSNFEYGLRVSAFPD